MLDPEGAKRPALICGGSDESNWDFSAVTSYLIDASQRGVLIVDGDIDESIQDNGSIDGQSNDDLSYPESLPTEIGSLRDSYHGHFLKLRWIWILLISVLICLHATVTSFLLFERQNYKQLNRELESKIKLMKETAVNALVLSNQHVTRAPKLHRYDDGKDEDEETFNDHWKFKLIDNCWFKAEVQLRECANEAKDSFADTAEKVYDYFAGPRTASEGQENTDENNMTGSSYCELSSLATRGSAAVAATATQIIDSMWAFQSKSWSSSVLQVAVDQTRDAIRDALPDQLVSFDGSG